MLDWASARCAAHPHISFSRMEEATLRLDARYVGSRTLGYNVRIIGTTLRYALYPGRALDLRPDSTRDRHVYKERHGL